MTGTLPRLLGLIYPLCATEGTDGLPAPAPIDVAKLGRPRPRNSALAAPPGMHLLPDIVTRRREVPPLRLYEVLKLVALRQPRTLLHAEFPDLLQAHFVARSALCNFPDVIAIQITPDQMPALYSRSLYGHADFGVNRQRLVTWLTALDIALELA
jgi:hypothetical protein